MSGRSARRIVVSGRVQGVGYRPYVYRTAHELDISGWVLNGAGKVVIHAEGLPARLDRLERALISSAPPLARPQLASSSTVEPEALRGFEIRPSADADRPEIHIPPDLFTCNDCLEEMTDPGERRHRYPFINCTQCGPRYTIITAMPYDRPNTSMADFPLCDDCRAEYESPLDRRFHAQPLACAACGPQLQFGTPGRWTTGNEAAVRAAVDALQQGRIVAVKGVGGYHLVCDAANDDAVRQLRIRKHRPHKPLAVMFPLTGPDGLEYVRLHTDPSAEEAAQISSPERPIVLAKKSASYALGPSITGDLAELGVFLPYSPLHHRLLNVFRRPIVATSGNLSGEPVLTDKQAAERRLADICDAFLHHDRPIVRPADDSVVRIVGGRPQLIRPGRGMAPLELDLPEADPISPVMALGGHMKNTVALAWGHRVVISPHVGELDTPRSMKVFAQVVADLQNLYGIEAGRLLCDRHPGYASTRWARRQALPSEMIFHHHAHASALAGEHPDMGTWLTFTWDGVGYGEDATAWGGEAFMGTPGSWRRVASFVPMHVLGGDLAAREPWRSAAGLMWANGCEWTPAINDLNLAVTAWRSGVGVHETSAVGRLFDAAAALVLGRTHASFEGQGPMELEAIAQPGAEPIALPWSPDEKGLPRCDPAPLLQVLVDERMESSLRASVFHASLAAALVAQARSLHEQFGFDAVGLSGGVFQNRVLTENVLAGLAAAGIPARTHRLVPANDAGLCFGQVVEHRARAARRKH